MELLKNLEGLSADEQMTAVVELQKAAMKHLEEQKQASIGKSAELVIQGLKKIKSDFEAKFDSLNYDIQTKVASLKDGEQGLQGPKGDQGERGLDGANGRDGRDGKDGKDGIDGVDGVGVRDAKIDFDGSLVISLTDGREINCGEVVSVDVAKQIQKVTHNIQTGAGGDSQTVLDAIAAIQATIATYGTMATQNANNVAITGGAINNTTIGATTPSTGVFTTLTATSTATLGGDATNPSLVAAAVSAPTRWLQVAGSAAGNVTLSVQGTGTPNLVLQNRSTGAINFATASSSSNVQAVVTHTASAVNYVQVTGAATGGKPTIFATGSDGSVGLQFQVKNVLPITFNGAGGDNFAVMPVYTTGPAVSYLQASGGPTGNVPLLSAVSSVANMGMAFQSKGTGAIDLAAGSSGVNISNGGTVTAITRTNAGSGYTSFPTPAISAPTTAGGVQATATVTNMFAAGVTIAGGGTGYTVNDVLTVSGGTPQTSVQLTVSTVSAGVITAVTISTAGAYTALPTNPVSVTGGTGSGATFNLTWSVIGFTITNAGSGYVEQPTVTFSGGGGSGAAAYATVGSATVIRSLGPAMDFYTPAGTGFRVGDAGATSTYYWQAIGGAFNGILRGGGSTQNALIQTGGTGGISLQTNNGAQTQAIVTHTASAVNYVQVTGAATSGSPTISAQGSDTNTGLVLATKGTGGFNFSSNGNSIFTGNSGTHFRVRTDIANASTFWEVFGSTGGPIFRSTGATAQIQTSGGALSLQTDNSGTTQLNVSHTASAVNYVQVTGAATTGYPVISAQGSDSSAGLILQTKGSGYVRFSTGGGPNSDQLRVNHTANPVNYAQITGAAAGASPVFSVAGSDTNIDLTLTPKGTGNVRFGTYTGTALSIAGYIEIKDSGGTVRKLAVVA